MPERPRDQYLDLPEGEQLSGEHLDEQVQKAEMTEQTLRRQLEAVERQKRELEELSRRQEQLQVGKSEMIDKLTRSLVVLEREVFDAKKRVELLQTINAAFTTQLETLETLNPKEWEGLDMNKELTRALASVDDARAEYSKSYPKISTLAEHTGSGDDGSPLSYMADYGPGTDKDFVGWVKIGFALTLPLVLLGIVCLLVFATR